MADKKAEAAKRLKERTAKKRFKLPEGETTFRVLPNAKGTDRSEYYEYGMHSNVGPRQSYMRCGKNANGEGMCWLCDETLPKLENSKKAAKKNAAQKMARRDVFAIQIAYLSDGQWIGPVLWEMSQGLANKMLGIFASKKRDVADPEKGYNLTITRTGTGMTDTKYGDIDRDEDQSEVSPKILAKLKPFSDVIRRYDEAEMKSAYYGHEQSDEDEEEIKEETTQSSDEDEDEEEPSKKKSSKKPVDEDEEDDGEEASEDEEEETPKKASKKPLNDEDEDEEEAPKKKPKKTVDGDEDDIEAALEDDDDIPNLEDDEEEEQPKKKGNKKDEDEDEEEPSKKKSSKKSDDEDEGDDEEEERPKKKGTRSRDDDDDD